MSLTIRIHDLTASSFTEAIKLQVEEMAQRHDPEILRVGFGLPKGLDLLLPSQLRGRPLWTQQGDGTWLTWFTVLLQDVAAATDHPVSGGRKTTVAPTLLVGFEVRTVQKDAAARDIWVEVHYDPQKAEKPQMVSHFLELFNVVEKDSKSHVLHQLADKSTILAIVNRADPEYVPKLWPILERPWEKIEGKRDRLIIQLWWQGRDVAHIAGIFGVGEGHVKNVLVDLRKEHGNEVVPYKDDLIRMGIRKK